METLLEKLQRRDADALAQWVGDYHNDLYRFLRQLTRHVETAEDLTQQTFVKALGSIGSFEGRCSMRTWLHQIAFREYAAWRRRHRILAPLNPKWAATDRNLDGITDQQGLLTALQKLHPNHREAFLLFEVQELSLEEISQVTGASVGVVKSRLHHARQKLRSLLSAGYQEVIIHEH
jgi:RNA polymerase sigma-70 factor (ECF subfamily)